MKQSSLLVLSLVFLVYRAEGYVADFMLGNGTVGKPQGVAIDPIARTLFISDAQHNRILRYDHVDTLHTNSPPSIVLGQPNLESTSPNQNSTPSAYGLSEPLALCVDARGTLWVSDATNNRVLWYLNASQLSSGAPADGFLGQPSFNETAVGSGQSGMNHPQDVSVEGGFVWVADAGNNRLVLLNLFLFLLVLCLELQVNKLSFFFFFFPQLHRVLRFALPTSSPPSGPTQALGVIGQPDFNSSSVATNNCTQYAITKPSAILKVLNGGLYVCDWGHTNRVVRDKKLL